MIVAANSFDPEQISPDGGNLRFGLPLWRFISPRAQSIPVRYRQSAKVKLAVARERQRRHRHEGRRYHVVGQCRGQRHAQRRCVKLHRMGRYDISGQSQVARCMGSRHYRSLRDRRQTQQRRLYLARLDSKATQLDLLVDTSEMLDISVFEEAPQVARPIEPLPGGKRILDKAFRREGIAIQITTCDTKATHVQLAHRAVRQHATRAIEDIDRGCWYRPTNVVVWLEQIFAR
ncbi:hypothetical protein DyAD56_23530 [Dyella sp. AD56]|nr:hypothetical protein DyAD56_23530 [Dyella sp. AD56]